MYTKYVCNLNNDVSLSENTFKCIVVSNNTHAYCILKSVFRSELEFAFERLTLIIHRYSILKNE